MSFPASREARDMELATTRFRVAVLPLDGELSAALCTGEAGNGAQSAGRLSPPNPTGESTVPTAPPKYAAARKPSDSVNATNFLRI